MGTNHLPDIYTPSPRAEGVYIKQTTSAHGMYDQYMPLFVHVQITAAQSFCNNSFSVFIVGLFTFDCGFDTMFILCMFCFSKSVCVRVCDCVSAQQAINVK